MYYTQNKNKNSFLTSKLSSFNFTCKFITGPFKFKIPVRLIKTDPFQ